MSDVDDYEVFCFIFIFYLCAVFKCQQNFKEFCFPGNIDYLLGEHYNYYSKRLFELLFVRKTVPPAAHRPVVFIVFYAIKILSMGPRYFFYCLLPDWIVLNATDVRF